MSSDEVTLKLEERAVIGKRLHTLRDAGQIPIVVHNYGKDSIHASGEHVAVEKTVHTAGRHHPVELKLGEDSRLALIREVDYDPNKNFVRHVVFQSIRRNQKTTADIPIELEGDVPAEQSGLMVLRQHDTVEVEALPSDLPDTIIADGTMLREVGDTLSVADLRVPKGVTILTDETYPIATVEAPKDQLAEADAAAEALAEDAEASGIPEEGEEADETSAEGEQSGAADQSEDSDNKKDTDA